MRMKPKSRKEILDICQSNFFSYSTLTKVLIIVCVLLSAGAVALYLCGYILPTIKGVVYGEIVEWDLVWKICLTFIYYGALKFVNLFLVSFGGAAMCREENWEVEDFAKAWVDMYKYEEFLNNKDFEE